MRLCTVILPLLCFFSQGVCHVIGKIHFQNGITTVFSKKSKSHLLFYSVLIWFPLTGVLWSTQGRYESVHGQWYAAENTPGLLLTTFRNWMPTWLYLSYRAMNEQMWPLSTLHQFPGTAVECKMKHRTKKRSLCFASFLWNHKCVIHIV